MVANETQQMYGMSTAAAILSNFQVRTISHAMHTHNGMMISRPVAGLSNPKNPIDQKAFRTSCAVKTDNKLCFSLLGAEDTHIRYKEIPIRTYKVVQTGPKTLFGGLKLGFCRPAYHVGMADVVNADPIPPARNGPAKEISSFVSRFM